MVVLKRLLKGKLVLLNTALIVSSLILTANVFAKPQTQPEVEVQTQPEIQSQTQSEEQPQAQTEEQPQAQPQVQPQGQGKWVVQEGFDFYAKTPFNAGLRSLLLPGWGQFFNQERTKGYVIAGATVLSLAAAIMMYNKANDTYNEYQDKGIRDDPLYDDYSKQLDQSRIFGYLTAGVWVWGVVDAYLFASSRDATSKVDKEIRLGRISFEMQRREQFALVYKKQF